MKVHSLSNKKSSRPMRFAFWGSLLGICLAVGIMFAQILSELPSMEHLISPPSEASVLISADGTILQNYYYQENRISIFLDNIPTYVIDALISVEDVRFYDHSGIDIQALPTIIATSLTGKGLRGGSTITMQLARNLFPEIKQDAVWKRKIKEYFLAVRLEKTYTKTEILERYLNTVSFGENIYGIQLASERYFDQSPQDLSIEQAATLMGMLKATTYYNPRRSPQRARVRRNVVFGQMLKYGCIKTVEERDSLQDLPLEVSYQRPITNSGFAPHFSEYVRLEMKNWGKEHGVNLYEDGLRIYSTIDLRMQAIAEQAVQEGVSEIQQNFNYFQFGVREKGAIDQIVNHPAWKQYWGVHVDVERDLIQEFRSRYESSLLPESIDSVLTTPRKMTLYTLDGAQQAILSPLDSMKYIATQVEVGLVAIDPSTGLVKAWVGGSNFRNSKYDHVAQSRRQPGSAFKPFVYATAIGFGYHPCDQYLNQLVTFDDGDGNSWTPRNADGETGGMVSLKRALALSLNIIAASLIEDVTPKAVINTANRMGIQSQLQESHTIALGTSEVNLLELTSAYMTFVNDGRRIDPIFLTRIENNRGKSLFESRSEKREVLNSHTAYIMLKMLEEVVDEGTATSLREVYQFKSALAGKTGTSQENADGWFVGLTPSLAIGVWVGWNDRRIHFDKDDYRFGAGNRTTIPIAARFLQGIYESAEIGMPQEGEFYMPQGFDMSILDCEN